MDFINEKIRVILEVIRGEIEKEVYSPKLLISKEGEAFLPYERDMRICETDCHYKIKTEVPSLSAKENYEYRFYLKTGREGEWDATNPQCTVFIDKKAICGLDTHHTSFPLAADKKTELEIKLYTGLVPGEFTLSAAVKSINLILERLYYDIKVPYECLKLSEKGSEDYYAIQNALNCALQILDMRNVGSEEFSESAKKASEYLYREFYKKECGKSGKIIDCIGHTHIDVAWQWTVAQSREKAVRSFATVLNLMERYPKYKFMSSQPVLYKFVKEDAPELYERIKEKIREGRWEAEGAMWLEADTNVPSGESLIRQIVYGKRFMREEFGIDNKILWLPDVFGYSAALPQILKKCGVDKFFTTKLNWNETDSMPHDNFIWEGIDKSCVFAMFSHQYYAMLEPEIIALHSNEFREHRLGTNPMITFGYADGGGGATYQMLENFDRLEYGIPGMPKTEMKTVTEIFDETEEKFNEKTAALKDVPKWAGEMYLEMHRGTYTSIAKNKKNNRKSEILMENAETAALTDRLLLGGDYPAKVFRGIWETILLNQFHDIIPGSSIKAVYDQTDIEYKDIFDRGGKIFDGAVERIYKNIETGGGIFVYNPTPHTQSDTVELDGKRFLAKDIPAHGWAVIKKEEAPEVTVSKYAIENDLIKVEFDENYEIKSVFDKALNREIAQSGERLNRLEVFEDFPRAYDAWEISEYYNQKKYAVQDICSVETADCGIKVMRRFNKSIICQEISLRPYSKRIDFKTEIDWQETHMLLKAAFPLDIYASEASYQIQFGYIKRPTHKNTSWDRAKFEVCGHRFADISEDNYGVSLLNDCKYGYSCDENVLSLSLLKSAMEPCPDADKGKHSFTYALYPHSGVLCGSDTEKEAALLNNPFTVKEIGSQDGKLPETFSFASSDTQNIIVETVKMSEDGEDIILRIYNCENTKERVNVSIGVPFKAAYICNMLEQNDEKCSHIGQDIPLEIANFEVITLKLKL